MRVPVILASAWIACIGCASSMALAQEHEPKPQCLSAAEIGNVSRMATVMAIGVSVQRCNKCIGPTEYPQVVKSYENAKLDDDFLNAKAALEKNRAKLGYVDPLVRSSARNLAATMSGDCIRCEKATQTVHGLATESARAAYYKAEADTIAKASAVETCP
jgi:hypothetical protein